MFNDLFLQLPSYPTLNYSFNFLSSWVRSIGRLNTDQYLFSFLEKNLPFLRKDNFLTNVFLAKIETFIHHDMFACNGTKRDVTPHPHLPPCRCVMKIMYSLLLLYEFHISLFGMFLKIHLNLSNRVRVLFYQTKIHKPFDFHDTTVQTPQVATQATCDISRVGYYNVSNYFFVGAWQHIFFDFHTMYFVEKKKHRKKHFLYIDRKMTFHWLYFV